MEINTHILELYPIATAIDWTVLKEGCK